MHAKASRLAVAALVVLVGCSSTPERPRTQQATTTTLPTLSGALILTSIDGVEASDDGSCEGKSGYDDIQPGATVTVSNESGTTIATGTLGNGVTTDVDWQCRFVFSISSVPVAKFYKIEVSHRGQVTYSHADMTSQNWDVTLTL
jgi:hypothetical protein